MANAIELSVLAVNQHRSLLIEYEDGQNRSTARTIKPYWVTQNKQGCVYVHAYCDMRQEERTFRADRMQSAELGEEVPAEEYLTKCHKIGYPMVGGTFLAQVTGLYG